MTRYKKYTHKDPTWDNFWKLNYFSFRANPFNSDQSDRGIDNFELSRRFTERINIDGITVGIIDGSWAIEYETEEALTMFNMRYS